MENETKLWLAESMPAYESPRVDVFEVEVERGFTDSDFVGSGDIESQTDGGTLQ